MGKDLRECLDDDGALLRKEVFHLAALATPMGQTVTANQHRFIGRMVRERIRHHHRFVQARRALLQQGLDVVPCMCKRGVLAVNIMPSFGTVHENEAAFDVAIAAITSGDSAWGRSILAALRDHICSTGEQKSVQWILPKVLEALEALDPSLLTTASHVS